MRQERQVLEQRSVAQPHVAVVSRRDEEHFHDLEAGLQRPGGCSGPGQRHVRHGSGGVTVCHRPAMPGDTQRLVQLSLEPDPRDWQHPGGHHGAQSPSGRHGSPGCLRPPLWTKCWQPLRLRGRRLSSPPTLKHHPGSSCPTSTCGPSATPCMRWVACSCWIMQAYEQGGHAYHATMPSDSLARFNEVMKETQAYGFDKVFDGYDAGRRDFVPDP
jgi:hypothetical protein